MGAVPSVSLPSPAPVVASGPSSSPQLPLGPANFTTFQLPSSNSNDISVNIGMLQECIGNPVGSDLLNNCITSNINGLDKQSNSYQNIKYVGPGHTIDSTGRVTFGQNIQSFQNIESSVTTINVVIIYIVIVVLYLFIMLNK
jgi:hypothetical protein